MSSENDPTVPVPTTGPGAPTAPIRRSATGGPTTEQPTTPVPWAGARQTGDPTVTLPTTDDAAGHQVTADAVGPADRAAGDTSPGDPERPGTTHALPVRGPAPAAEGAGSIPGAGADARPTDRPARATGPLAARTGAERDDDTRTGRPPLRVGTVVWGLVLAVIGTGIIAVAAGAQIDVELALIALLALAGVGLVVGSVVTGVRRRH